MRVGIAPLLIIIGLISALVLAPTIFSASYVSIPSSGTISYGTLLLHVEGRHIKDSKGTIVYLRGIHKPGFLDPPHTGWFVQEGATNPAQGTQEFNIDNVAYNLDKMAEMGINTLRMFLPPCINWLSNIDGVRDRVGTVISMAAERRIYVILTGYTVGASAGQTPIPWDPYTKTNERGIFTSSDDYVDFMLQLVSYYSGHPNVIYEFWNEPHGPIHEEFFNVCQDTLNQVRASGDTHLMIYEFGYTGYESQQAIVNQGWILNYTLNPNITNIVYSVHCYRYIDGAGYISYFEQKHLYNDVRQLLMDSGNGFGFYMQAVKDLDLPQGIFEFAACNRIPSADWQNELEANMNMMRVCNEEGFSYTPLHWWGQERQFGMFVETTPTNPWLPPLNEWGIIIRDAIADALS